MRISDAGWGGKGDLPQNRVNNPLVFQRIDPCSVGEPLSPLGRGGVSEDYDTPAQGVLHQVGAVVDVELGHEAANRR